MRNSQLNNVRADHGFSQLIWRKLQDLGQELLDAHEQHLWTIDARVQERDIEIELLQEQINRVEEKERELEQELQEAKTDQHMRKSLEDERFTSKTSEPCHKTYSDESAEASPAHSFLGFFHPRGSGGFFGFHHHPKSDGDSGGFFGKSKHFFLDRHHHGDHHKGHHNGHKAKKRMATSLTSLRGSRTRSAVRSSDKRFSDVRVSNTRVSNNRVSNFNEVEEVVPEVEPEASRHTEPKTTADKMALQQLAMQRAAGPIDTPCEKQANTPRGHDAAESRFSHDSLSSTASRKSVPESRKSKVSFADDQDTASTSHENSVESMSSIGPKGFLESTENASIVEINGEKKPEEVPAGMAILPPAESSTQVEPPPPIRCEPLPPPTPKFSSTLGPLTISENGQWLQPLGSEIVEHHRAAHFSAGHEDHGHGFELLPTWFVDQQVTKISQISGFHRMPTFFDDDISSSSGESSDESTDTIPLSTRLRIRAHKICVNVMIHPNAGGRMCWDLVATLLVCWECVVVPLAFLNLKGNPFIDFMEWFSRVFWTFDIPLSFCTGFVKKEGLAEMRPRAVSWKYLKTWFPLDFLMVSVDWMEIVVQSASSLTAARMSKFLKSIRMVRMARLWRVLRIKSLPNGLKNILEYYFQSEVVGIVAAIVKILVLVVWINHVFACIWYGLGEGARDDKNWMHQHGYEDASKTYLYWTAFHWSLSQFTGNMEVVPENLAERMYAVITLLVIFVIGASSVSSITASITNLSIATAQESKKLAVLKRYLYEHRISSRIVLRVIRNAQYVNAELKKDTPEDKIELFLLLSEPLRIELHFEIHMPVLETHPFFTSYVKVCPGLMRQVCHSAVGQHRLAKGDVLFSEGEVDNSPSMFFVVAGNLKYAHTRSECYFTISPVQWLCEACLWTPWIHCGSMRARAECVLIVLVAEKVSQLAVRFHENVSYAQRYGHGFVKHLNSQEYEKLTDLEDEDMNISWLAEKSLPSNKESSRQESVTLKKSRLKKRVTNAVTRVARSVFRPSVAPKMHSKPRKTGSGSFTAASSVMSTVMSPSGSEAFGQRGSR